MLISGRQPEFTQLYSIAEGAEYNVSAWRLHAHTGTHVETGLHYVDGRETIDAVAIERLVGPARVLDLTAVEGEEISPADLRAAGYAGQERVLLKTANSAARDPRAREARLLGRPRHRGGGAARRVRHPPARRRLPLGRDPGRRRLRRVAGPHRSSAAPACSCSRCVDLDGDRARRLPARLPAAEAGGRRGRPRPRRPDRGHDHRSIIAAEYFGSSRRPKYSAENAVRSVEDRARR